MVDQDSSIYTPQPTAYGRIIREKGTLRLVMIAVVLAIAWYIYDSVHTNMMNQVKWPTLQPSASGLVVLGLRDKDRPGWQHKFEAREQSHYWQIRYTEDDSGDNNSQPKDDTPGSDERGSSNPGASHHVNSGAVVPMDVIMKECPVVLNGSHFTGATVEEKFEHFKNVPYYALHLDLSEEGRSRYWQYANSHEGERLAFILNNETVTCPELANFYVSSFTIDPIWDKADAQKLADYINGQSKK